VHFDTYRGCAHGCSYCFARAKRDLADVRPGESVAALRRWLDGHRTRETAWCDWRIPLHFGGLSDPLQPCERQQRRTLACLELLAEKRYPFVLSTKGVLAIEPPWRNVLAGCNVVVQVSMTSPRFDRLEPGAPPFAARLKMLRNLAQLVPRVIVRVQPYVPHVLNDVLRALPRYAAAGVHGITIEGMKSKRAAHGLVKVTGDWCYPVEVLEPHFLRIREHCHRLGLRFYAAENRLRRLGDDRCCCGIDGLPGFVPNRANLNAPVFGLPLRYRRAMRQPGSAGAFKSLAQSPLSSVALKRFSYADCMGIVARVPAYRAAMGLSPAAAD
jgi:DNA repair photolyase